MLQATDSFYVVDPGEFDDHKEDPRRFQEARDGDHLVCPFVCDACEFWSIKGREPVSGNHQDDMFAICVRRAILDAFWARERGTVDKNFGESENTDATWRR